MAHRGIDKEVARFIHGQRNKRLVVLYEDIAVKGETAARGLRIPCDCFRVSKKWVANLMKRNGLSVRRRTTFCHKQLEVYEEKIEVFHQCVISLRKETEFLLGQIGNANQTSVWSLRPLGLLDTGC